ncbi:FadR/GntR family transcriptional regulator [Micromonospora echinofusca]|uniref:GntR family transcriptional regulator n=1 Tax=Micromonospora echinofusca TaxID=47858 RepID=A0ABS3VKI4_MICEH|nr:GntR family transcriptional regulator [Micromonospora echinofusca]MBO4205019.1 GntR family transcriptional regulator [Micromonospora echinofusca]
MNLRPVPRSSVSDHVFGQLRDAIVSGTYAPGDPLPSERELGAVLTVNRHAVREALRRLQQLGLVRVSQGGATRVLDWRVHAGLDLAMSLTQVDEVLPIDTLVRDVLEMRACIGTDAARLCALRADPATRAAVTGAVTGYVGAAPDLDRMDQANIALWRQIVQGSGNTAYLLAFNSLVGGALAVGRVPPQRRTAELLDTAGHRRLAALIADGDGDGAAGQAHTLLTAPVTAATERTRT